MVRHGGGTRIRAFRDTVDTVMSLTARPEGVLINVRLILHEGHSAQFVVWWDHDVEVVQAAVLQMRADRLLHPFKENIEEKHQQSLE